MEKPFLEVFPGLHIADELRELLNLVRGGEGYHPRKDRSSIRIYIVSPRLIHKKKHLQPGATASHKQLFPGADAYM